MCKSLLYKVRILFHPCNKINDTLSMFNLQVSGLVYSFFYEYVKIQRDKGPHTSLSYLKPRLPPRKEVMCSHRGHCTVSKNYPFNDEILNSDILRKLNPRFKSLCLNFQWAQRCTYFFAQRCNYLTMKVSD